MRHIVLAAVTILLIACGAGGRPLLRTEQTQDKTDAEMQADIKDCQQQQGETWLIGPAVAIIPLTMIVGASKDVGLRNCLEAKGYKFGPTPPIKSGYQQGMPGSQMVPPGTR